MDKINFNITKNITENVKSFYKNCMTYFMYAKEN